MSKIVGQSHPERENTVIIFMLNCREELHVEETEHGKGWAQKDPISRSAESPYCGQNKTWRGPWLESWITCRRWRSR